MLFLVMFHPKILHCFQAGCEAVGGCAWCFSGQGWQYQVLAGPGFIVMFTISGVIMGYLADRFVTLH